eukprot:15478712-Alexandrium_andersonii.AAC.1
MADSPRGQAWTLSTEAHWGPPSEPPQARRRAAGEDARPRRPGAPRSGAPSRPVGALSPIARR